MSAMLRPKITTDWWDITNDAQSDKICTMNSAWQKAGDVIGWIHNGTTATYVIAFVEHRYAAEHGSKQIVGVRSARSMEFGK